MDAVTWPYILVCLVYVHSLSAYAYHEGISFVLAMWAKAAGVSFDPSCVVAPLVASMSTHLTAFISLPSMKTARGDGLKDLALGVGGVAPVASPTPDLRRATRRMSTAARRRRLQLDCSLI
jgi:hypothetical protein